MWMGTLALQRCSTHPTNDAFNRAGTVEKASVDEAYLDITPDAMDIIHQADEGGGDGGDEEERSSRLCPSSSGSNVYGALDLMMEGDCLLAVRHPAPPPVLPRCVAVLPLSCAERCSVS